MNLAFETLQYFYEKRIEKNKELCEFTALISPEIVKNYEKSYSDVDELETMLSTFDDIDFQPLKRFKDKKNPEVTTTNSGLYLIGNTVFNPKNRRHYYWVKVGSAHKNIKKRIMQYVTYNPMFYNIDTYSVEEEQKISALENCCHLLLSQIAITKKGQEWFMVEKEDYMSICREGFSWFGLE